MWEKRASTGEPGSEGGRVLEDETYKGECRITRERCQADDAITCGYTEIWCTPFFASRRPRKRFMKR